MKLGLALGSGGARGLAHIGVIEVLEENNIKIDYVSGTSMGSIIGGYYALYGNIAGIKKIVLDFKRRDLMRILDINNPKFSLIKGEKAKKFVQEFLGEKTFKDTVIPLRISATALEDGSQVVFSKGKLIEAVMASSSFPGVLPPYEYKGKHLIDGGIVDVIPTDLVRKLGADVIVAVDLFGSYESRDQELGIKNVMVRTYEMVARQLSMEKDYGKNTVLIKPEVGGELHILEFFNAKQFIDAGRKAAEKKVKEIKKMLK